MKKIALIMTLLIALSACSYMHVRKMDVEQGNVLTEEDTKQLHVGMSQSDVTALAGTPLMMNTFSENRIDYVYTYKPGYGHKREKFIALEFSHGKLKAIKSMG